MQEAIKVEEGGEKAKKPAVPLIDAKIHIFAPMGDQAVYVALIGNLSFAFKGATPMAAHKAADDWRKAEWLKLTSKAERERHAAAKSEAVAP